MLNKPIEALKKTLEESSEIKESDTEVRIHVDEIAAKIAKVYEKIRNVVDYREEHLLRKNNIIRSLRRNIFLRASDDRSIAEKLIKEIIRAGHLPNDTIPERKISEVQQTIDHLFVFLDSLPALHSVPERYDMSQWLIQVTACAIEEQLAPPTKDRLIATAMFATLHERLVVKGGVISDNDIVAQLFIGIQRQLLRVDDDQLSYRLLCFMYPNWDTPTPEELAGFSQNIVAVKKAVEEYIESNPHKTLFAKLCQKASTSFLLLRDALWSDPEFTSKPETLLVKPEKLTEVVDLMYRRRFTELKSRLKRLAFLTIVSLFITKVIIALAVEIPIDVYVTKDFSLTNTLINILFPPLLMFVILMFIRLPSKRNLALVLEDVQSVVYQERRKEYLMVVPQEKSEAVRIVVRSTYFIVSVIVLWFVIRLLRSINFSWASTVVFILFTSIVAATGVRAHNRSKEISLEERKASFMGFIGDLLFVPFVTIGQFTIAGLSKFAFLVVIVNLIDTPFLVFVSFIENFNLFLRSKKDEIG